MYQLVAQVRTQQWITMIREIVGNEIPEFVEIHQPDLSAAENPKNITTTAVIQSGRIQISLSNSASEELIARIMRNLNA